MDVSRERSFASNYFIFFKKNFQFKHLFQRVDLKYQLLKCPYSNISKALEFCLRLLFTWG